MQTSVPASHPANWEARELSAVVVLGGHRCGTSCIAGTIAHLGVPCALPGDEIGPSPSNARGHFEDATLCRMHEQMLGRGGWRDPRPGSRVEPFLLEEYDAHLRRRVAATKRICIKDPRLCLLLPFLVERLRFQRVPVRVVTVTRDPSAAAESLRRRHRVHRDAALRIAWLYEGARRGQLSWLTQQEVPVLAIDYHRALRNRENTVARLAAFVGLPPTEAAAEFLEPGLRHN